MPDPIAPPAAPPPVAPPPVPPPPPQEPPPSSPPGAPAPSPITAENDPNLQMSLLVARSKEKRDAKKAGKTVKPPEDAPEPPPEPPKPPGEQLTDLIQNALQTGNRKVQKKEEPPVTPPVTAPVAPVSPAEPPKGTKIGKKTPAVPALDPIALARETAAAAATAAVQAVTPRQAPTPEPPGVEESLKPSDRKEYEVAKFLAATDPKFRDAPKLILDNIKKAEGYAERWEAANPGKLFNPNDEEHNEFYDAIQAPWSPDEFEDAKIDMRASRNDAKWQQKIEELETQNIRLQLNTVAEKQFTDATAQIIDALGDEAKKAITEGGLEKLQDYDPTIAGALAHTLNELRPIVETIIEIDYSGGKIPIDLNNPRHRKWNEIVLEGERLCAGKADDQQRLFAKRADFNRMAPMEQSRHWTLTPDNLISGIVQYASSELKKRAEAENERIKAIATKRGWAAPTASTPPATPPASNGQAEPPAPTKPVSPSAGSGPPIDATAGKPLTGKDALMEKMSEILFRR